MNLYDKILPLADEWDGRAACRDRPELDLFPPNIKARPVSQKIKEMCQACPLGGMTGQCLQIAFSVTQDQDQDGIFGGLSVFQRDEIRAEYQRQNNGELIEDRNRR
jgi:hypothetical protein